jgi:hypothetical protein
MGRGKSVPNLEVFSFYEAITSPENNILGPEELSLFHRKFTFHRDAINRFHCNVMCVCVSYLSVKDCLSFLCHQSYVNEFPGLCPTTWMTMDLDC